MWSFWLVFIGFELFCYKFWNKKKLMMSTGTCGLKLHARKNVFKKKNCKYEILNHLYFDPNIVFCGTTLGRFNQCFFLIFCPYSTMVADIFTRPPSPNHYKKFSYGPDKGTVFEKVCRLFWKKTMLTLRRPWFLVLKGLVSETKYLCVLTYQISSL